MQFKFRKEKIFMKKFLKIISAVVCLACLLTVSVCAYEFDGNSKFTVDIPEDFKNNSDGDIYSFESEDGKIFSISLEDNTSNLCIKDMKKRDIEEWQTFMENSTEEQMREYGLNSDIDFLSTEKTELADGKLVLSNIIKTDIDGSGNVYYQKTYVYGGTDNIYTFVYTTTDEDKTDELDSIFASIKVNEEPAAGKWDDPWIYLVAVAMAGLAFAGIIRFLRTPEKRAQGTL
jgi:hypothetical protein